MWSHWNDQILQFEYWGTGNEFFSNNEWESDYSILCVPVLQIKEFSELNGWPLIDVCFGYKGLVVTLSSSSTHGRCQLNFWRMDSFCKTTYLDHLHHLNIPESGQCKYSLWMDEHFVVVFQRGENSGTVFIVSIKTRTVVENFSHSSLECVRYEQGLLMMKYPSVFR